MFHTVWWKEKMHVYAFFQETYKYNKCAFVIANLYIWLTFANGESRNFLLLQKHIRLASD